MFINNPLLTSCQEKKQKKNSVDLCFYRPYNRNFNVQNIEKWENEMVFDKRLGILRGGNVISAGVENQVRTVISRLEDRWRIILTEETGGRIVTHLAMALMRIERGEDIAAPEDDVLEEFRNLEVFEASSEITDDLISFTPMNLPKAERDYMIVNICLLLEKKNDGKRRVIE
jgi:hypothetical protein